MAYKIPSICISSQNEKSIPAPLKAGKEYYFQTPLVKKLNRLEAKESLDEGRPLNPGEVITMEGDKPITFKALGKTLPKLPKLNPQFTVRMSDFAEYGYCPYTAWHLSRGTPAIHVPKIERAIANGRIAHDKLDRAHEKEIAKLPKATKEALLKKHKPLAFPRNLPVSLYHKPFLYVGKIDLVKRESDGNLYITDDKFTVRLPEQPWFSHRLQVWIYCTGMASTYWRKIDAKYLYWQVQYYANREKTEVLGDPLGDLYSRSHHGILLKSIENFEAIYQGNDLGLEANPNKCRICKFAHSCQFKAI